MFRTLNTFRKMFAQIFSNILSHTAMKVGDIFSHIWAWIAGLGLFIAEAFAGHTAVIYTILVLTTLDMIWGVAVARKLKEYTRSELLRQTVFKLLVYATLLIAFILLDKLVGDSVGLTITITTGFVGMIVSLVEIVSSIASMLILWPNMPILRMLKKVLMGEIAGKLGCDVKEVDKILKGGKPAPKRDKNGRFISNKRKK